MPSFVDSERFAKIPPLQRDRLESFAKLQQFDDGDVIHSQQRPFTSLAIISTGEVDLRLPGPAEGTNLGTLVAGDILGELDPKQDMPEGLRYVARGETILRAIAKSPLRQELLNHRELATQLLFVYARAISEKIRMVNEVATSLTARAMERGVSLRPPPTDQRSSHLTDDEARWLAVLGDRVTYEAGTVIIEEGDTSRDFFVIEEGQVDVRRSTEGGQQAIIAELGHHDLFGHMAFIDGKPRSASVVVSDGVESVACTRVAPDALERALSLNFTLAFNFLGSVRKVLGRMLADTVRQVATVMRDSL